MLSSHKGGPAQKTSEAPAFDQCLSNAEHRDAKNYCLPWDTTPTQGGGAHKSKLKLPRKVQSNGLELLAEDSAPLTKH